VRLIDWRRVNAIWLGVAVEGEERAESLEDFFEGGLREAGGWQGDRLTRWPGEGVGLRMSRWGGEQVGMWGSTLVDFGFGGVESGEAVEEVGGFAGGFSGAAALLDGLEGFGVDREVAGLVEVFLDDVLEGAGCGGEGAGGDEAGLGGGRGWEDAEALEGFGLGEVEGEGFEGGVVVLGQEFKGEVGVGEVVEEAGGLLGGGDEDGGLGGHGKKRSSTQGRPVTFVRAPVTGRGGADRARGCGIMG
jgi:hypothetical protein